MSAQNKVVDINKNRDELITFTKEEVETIRNTVADNANPDELRMFLHIAKSYGLDPFNKEIFFWKIDGRPTIMTSRDGYLKIADRNPNYDGLVSDVVRENDKFRRKETGINHQYGTNRGQIIGAYALVYRKDRKYPVYVFAPYDEYKADKRVWNSYPSAMILKVAESMALKRAFTVSGLVSREEMNTQQMEDNNYDDVPFSQVQNSNDQSVDVEEVKADDNSELSKREEIIKEIVGNNNKLKNDLFNYLKHAKKENGLKQQEKISIDKLTEKQFEQLKSILSSFKKLA
jgi:phage recombination protein Bet